MGAQATVPHYIDLSDIGNVNAVSHEIKMDTLRGEWRNLQTFDFPSRWVVHSAQSVIYIHIIPYHATVATYSK